MNLHEIYLAAQIAAKEVVQPIYDDTDIKADIFELQEDLSEVKAALEEIRELAGSGINFLGDTCFKSNLRLRSDFSEAKVSISNSGTLNNDEGIFMMIQPDYDSYQNWEYKIQVTFAGNQSYPICLLGSKNSYWNNPSFEVQSDNYVWFGITKTDRVWEHNTGIFTDEPFTSGTTYDFYIGWDGTEIYFKIYNADTNTLIGIKTIAATINPQRNPNPADNPCILNNASTTRFSFLGTVNLMNCHFKANDEILWGQKNN